MATFGIQVANFLGLWVWEVVYMLGMTNLCLVLAIIVFVVSVPSQRDTKFDIGRPKRKSMLVPPPSLKL